MTLASSVNHMLVFYLGAVPFSPSNGAIWAALELIIGVILAARAAVFDISVSTAGPADSI